MPTAKSNHTTTTRRRALFGAAAAVTATTIVTPALAGPNPDAELIACCERLIAIEGEMNAICDTAHTAAGRDPDLNALHDENDDLMQRIEKLPDASTQEGLRKMSQAALVTSAQGQSGICDGEGEWLAFKVARILSGEGRPVRIDRSPANVDPDAELLSLCSAFHQAHAQLYATTDTERDAAALARERRWAISNKLQNIPARTDAGRLAKATVAFTVLRESDPEPQDMDSVTLLVYTALRDIAGSAVA